MSLTRTIRERLHSVAVACRQAAPGLDLDSLVADLEVFVQSRVDEARESPDVRWARRFAEALEHDTERWYDTVEFTAAAGVTCGVDPLTGARWWQRGSARVVVFPNGRVEWAPVPVTASDYVGGTWLGTESGHEPSPEVRAWLESGQHAGAHLFVDDEGLPVDEHRRCGPTPPRPWPR